MPQKVKSEKLKVKSSERGQVLLIVILVIIVALTIGLSLASRGITNLSTSTEEANSQKALAAAEAGIEKALQNTVSSSGSFGLSTYETNVATQGNDDTFLVNGGSLITQGEGVDIWFADHNPDGSINYAMTPARSTDRFHLFWGAPGEEDCDSSSSSWPAAIEAIVVSGTSATNITTIRHAFDLCDGSGGTDDRENNFEDAHSIGGGGIVLVPGGPTFMIRTPGSGKDLVDVGNLIFMRVIPVYKNTVIGIRACNSGGTQCTDLPSQGYQVTSTGKAGTASRKLNVFKGFSQIFLPYISYGLFVPKKF